MKYDVIRIIAKWSSLKENVLRFILKQKEFKCSIKGTKRYERIVNQMNLPYFSFTAFLAHQYNTFLVTFQAQNDIFVNKFI